MYEYIVEQGGKVSDAMQAFRKFLGTNDMLAYLSMMAPRLIELKRVLKPTGSIYLHCDPTASHYLKQLLDAVFGVNQFMNEIIWSYGPKATQRSISFQRKHDIIFFYTKHNGNHIFNSPLQEYGQGSLAERHTRYKNQDEKGRYRWTTRRNSKGDKYRAKVYLNEGVVMTDVWNIPIINATAKERLGYPTQKPEALLECIINASSLEGDIVLDPFCGCGTTIVVAQKLNRRWIGIDITHLAIALIRHRLHSAFDYQTLDSDSGKVSSSLNYEVIGEPKDSSGAKALAEQDRYQFQWWSLGLVGARPIEEKKGADKGIDGRIYFHDEPTGKTKQIIVSIKSGNTSVSHIRDLRGVIERENAEIGVLITLQEPSQPMKAETSGAGFYKSEWGNHSRLQILTVKELLEGKRIDRPPSQQADKTFKKAPKHVKESKGKTINWIEESNNTD